MSAMCKCVPVSPREAEIKFINYFDYGNDRPGVQDTLDHLLINL